MHIKAATAVFVALTVLKAVTAHTHFTNFYVNGVNQGDGTCVRMNTDPSQSVDPLKSITSAEMACGMLSLSSP